MNAKHWIIIMFLLSSLQAKTHILKIDDIVEIALKHSPDIDSSRLDFNLAQQRTKKSEGLYLPQVDLSANSGKQWSKFKRESFGNINMLIGGLSASQLLYDFGKTEGRITGSKQEGLALYAQMQQMISDKIFLVKKSYYDILKTKSIIDIYQKNIKLLKEQLYYAKRHFTSGIKTNIDVSHVEAELAQAHFDLENAQYELESQRINLEQTIGHIPYNGNYLIYSEKHSIKNLSRKLPIISTPLDQLESFAYKHRYIMQSSEYTVKAAQSNVQRAEGDYYPTILLNGDYNIQDVDINDINILPEQYGQIGIKMSWNLFSGYNTDRSVEEAKISVLKATSKIQSIRLLIRKQVRDSHINVRKNKNNVKLSANIAKGRLKKFKQAQNRYAKKLSHYLEIQDAHQGYIQALSNLVNNYYNYLISIAQLDHAIGK